METVYLVCAAVGGTLIVCQFLVTLLGLGGHDSVDAGGHDVSMGHDVGGSHEVGHGTEPAWFFSMLTFRTLTAAAAFFGLAGLAAINAELEPIPTLAIALAAGFCALAIVGWLMRMLTQFNVDGSSRIGHALGARGTVYLPIPSKKSGVGKVLISVLNRTLEYKAITSQEQLAAGAKIVVVAVIGPDTVEVASAHESERENHG